METFWVPGVNRLGTYGRWAFAELRDVYEMEEDFRGLVEARFKEALEPFLPNLHATAGHHLIRAGASRSDIQAPTEGEAERR